jgi:hypothetical protein
MRDPSEELSVHLSSNLDGSVGQPIGPKLRGKLRVSRGSNRMGRNAGECRAGLVSEVAEPSLHRTGEGRRGSVRTTEATDPAAGVMATARAKGSLSNVRGPTGCSCGERRRVRRRAGRESDRPIVPWKRVTTVEGRGLTFGMFARKGTVTGDWR